MKINKNGKIFTIKVNKEINSFKKGGLRKSYENGGKTNITYNGNKYVWDRTADKFYDVDGAEITDSTFVSNLNNYLLEKGIAAPSIEKEVSKTAISLPDNEVAFNLDRDFKYDYIYNKDNDTFAFKDKKSNKGYKVLIDNPEADTKLRARLKELNYGDKSNLELSTKSQVPENTSTKTNTSAFSNLGIIDESIKELDTYAEKVKEPNLNIKEQEDKKLEVKETESTTNNKNIETGKVFNLPGDSTYTYMTKDSKFYYNSAANKDWVEVNKKEAIAKLQDYLDGKIYSSTKSKINDNTVAKTFQNSNSNNSTKVNKNIPDYTGGAIFKDRGETIMSKEGDYYQIDGNKWIKVDNELVIQYFNKVVPKKIYRWKGYNQDMEKINLDNKEIKNAAATYSKNQPTLTKEEEQAIKNKEAQKRTQKAELDLRTKRINALKQGQGYRVGSVNDKKNAEEIYKKIRTVEQKFNISYEEALKKYNQIESDIKSIEAKIPVQENENRQDPNYWKTIRKQAEEIYYAKNPQNKFKKGGINNIMKTYKINNKIYTIKASESFKKGGKPKYQSGGKTYEQLLLDVYQSSLPEKNKKEKIAELEFLKSQGFDFANYEAEEKESNQLHLIDKIKDGRANKVAYDAAGSMDNLKAEQNAKMEKNAKKGAMVLDYNSEMSNKTKDYLTLDILNKEPENQEVARTKNQLYMDDLTKELMEVSNKLSRLKAGAQTPQTKESIQDLQSYITDLKYQINEIKKEGEVKPKQKSTTSEKGRIISQEEISNWGKEKAKTGNPTLKEKENNSKLPLYKQKGYSAI